MAGGPAKLVGAVLFTLGAFVVIAAAAVILAAVADQSDNEESGPLGATEDQDRTQDNHDRVETGLLAMSAGVLFALGGTLSVVIGLSQRGAEVRDAWRTAKQRRKVLLASADAAQVKAMEAEMDAEEAPDAPADAATEAEADVPSKWADSVWLTPQRLTIIGIPLAIVLVTVLIALALSGGEPRAEGPAGAVGASPTTTYVNDTASLAPSFVQATTDIVDLPVPAGTGVGHMDISWNGGNNLAIVLQVQIDGSWTTHTDAGTGGSPVAFHTEGDDPLRLVFTRPQGQTGLQTTTVDIRATFVAPA